ncbi:hypothetical protein IGJ01_001582 [Enterococcus sp. AZ089]|uniref:permease prefix domain 1-containing protein n=1 Tax=Enterococcus sp. AZ089 TaxID=2774693 RepID=UPI003D2F9E16
MKTIHDYLDSLFLSVPITPETKKAKEDLLAIMEDHYLELIHQGKSEHEAIGAVISEFGSVDELLQELDVSKEEEPIDDWSDAITEDDAFDYWGTVRHFAFSFSIGIGFCIASLAALMLFVSVYAETFGIMVMFLFIAIGVGFIISSSLHFSGARKQLDDRPIKRDAKREAAQQLANYEKSFRIGLVLGIGACILSIAPVLLSELFYYSVEFGISLFFLTVAVGVFFIIYVSIIRTGFAKLATETYFIRDEENLGDRATRHKYGESAGRVTFFRTVYWPVILVVYMLWSFMFHAWAYSWVIFVIGGVLEDYFIGQTKAKK